MMGTMQKTQEAQGEDCQELIERFLRLDRGITGFCLFVPDNHDLLAISGGKEALRHFRLSLQILLSEHFGESLIAYCPSERGLLVALCDSTETAARARVAGTLAALSSSSTDANGRRLSLTAHAGIAWLAPSGYKSAEALYRELITSALLTRDPWASRFSGNAAEAMADIGLTARLLCDLPAAISENRLRLAAQAIVPLSPQRDEELYEVLLTLRDRDGQSYPPALFMAGAEDCALIEMIDCWVLREVLVELAPKLAQHGRISLSVNVAARTICSPHFPQTLREAFRIGGLDPRRIQLEITETAVIHDPDLARANVEVARALGCRIALDDFGAGQSGYAYLKSFRPDCLKIDGTLIKDIQSPEDTDARIVRSITQLAHELGAEVVAEHVASPETLELLRKMGVDKVQGFEVGRPIDLRELLSSP